MGTFHHRTSHRPSILVGWAAGVVETWPEESPARYDLDRPRQASTADQILDALAAADNTDADDYAARHVADAGALLALTHHTVPAILAAALQVPGELSPSVVLGVLEGRPDHDAHGGLTHLLAS